MAMTKIKGLQQWCRRMTDGYTHVDVANFTTAWRDGMAFCAIIHRFRPDLIDYDALSPENVFDNCKLAFEVAEKELDIPAFLEAEDMARLKVPDKLSVITYVSQYYNFLHALPQLGGPGVKGKVTSKSPAGGKRPPNIDTGQAPSSKKVATGEDGKENVSAGIEKTRHGAVGDKCNICGNKVYLLERHIEAGKLYHRSCYRHSELSPTNKVYTRSPFLSPSLSKETPPLSPSAHMKTSSSNSDLHQHRTPGSHHHLHTGGGGGVVGALTAKADGEASKSSSQFSFPASAASSDSPRKIDSAGLKHSLSETDRGDAKKSKLQVSNENSVGQNLKANAIIDRLENLKGKYDSPQKENDSLSLGKKSDHKTPAPKEKEVFPLSGKESKQLEKRRDEILSAEKKAEKSSRAGARNVPLIFQQKDSDKATVSTSASSVLSKANHSSTPITPHSSNISSVITNTPTSTKNLDLTQRKTAIKVVKAELVSKKEAEDPENKCSLQNIMKQDKEKGKSNTKSAPYVKDNEKGDIASLQKKFLKSGEGGSTTVTPHPVAKARVHKPSDVSQHDINTVPTPSLRKNNNDGSATPKAAPRKSLLEKSVEINVSLGGSKDAPSTGANLLKVKPPNSARSSGSESPPMLPSTAPPPLPTSPQPSLPPSVVINLDNVKSKIKSSKEGKLGGGDTKSGQQEEITTHEPVKSSVAVSSQAVATTTTKRLSSPAIHDPSLTVFETKDKEEKQVLSGLLSSLAGVRGRSSSTPGITGLPFTTPGEPIPSDSSAALPSSSILSKRSPSPSFTPAEVPSPKTVIKTTKDRKTSELSVNIASKNVSLDSVKVVNKTSSTDTSKASGIHKKDNHTPQSIIPSIGKVPEALNVLNNLKKVKDSKPSEFSDSILKTGSGSTKIELMSENVHTKEKKKGALSASKENLNHISTKATSSDVLKQESSDHKASDNFKTVKLRQVTQPGANLTNPGVPSPASDFKLDKYENKTKEEKNKYHQPPAVSKSLFNKSEGDATTKSKTESNEHSSSKVQAKSQKPLNLYEEDELPDWKAALEERKKKLRENTPKHDNITVTISKSKEIPEIKDIKKSDKIQISPKNSELSPRSEKDKPDNYRSPRAKSPSPLLLKTSDAKSSVSLTGEKSAADKKLPSTPQSKNRIKSGDWKHDAEMKIAALGGFDSEEEVKEEKQPTKPKRTLPKLPDVVPDLQKAIKADKTKSQEKKAKEVSEEAPTESVPEFLTGISKLKPVKPQEENKQMMLNIKKTKPAPVHPVVNEDFRQRLQNLKHIHGGGEAIAESKNHSPEAVNSQDAVKSSLSVLQNTPVQPKSMPSSLREDIKNTNNNKNKEKVPPKLTQPSPLRGDSNNFNIKKSKEKKDVNSKKSLMDSINLASSPDVSDEEGQSKREKSSPQRHSTPIQENGKSSPKAKKKKIPFFGKNKKEKLESPAESPINPKKKIEAPVNLDFDKSSEFEASLSDATARLSIEDKKTPPQRPPPPQAKHKKILSPKHISAIELQQQLLDIDSRLTDLELRGRDLEDSIRNVNVLEEDDDALMIKWFELVSEKNDLVRQEADLMYMSREQDLETEQDHIEFQLRYLMNKSDADKSGAEKEEEEYLIQRKVELVEQRNRIVDSMDEDRLRYVEEDRDIEVTLRGKGLWKDSNGTFKAIKGKKVSNSTFYT